MNYICTMWHQRNVIISYFKAVGKQVLTYKKKFSLHAGIYKPNQPIFHFLGHFHGHSHISGTFRYHFRGLLMTSFEFD